MAHRPPSSGPHLGRTDAATGAQPVGKARAASGVAPAAAAEPVGRARSVEAADNVKAAAATAAAQPVAGVPSLARTAAPDRVHGIADRLRRGVLTPSQAVEELIEDAVQRNLPGLQADSPLTQELRTLLLSYAKDDPYLASRISRLGIQR